MRIFLGSYPPTSKVYDHDVVKTLLENSCLSFNANVPIVDTEGKITGVISKSALAKWLLESIAKSDMPEELMFMPLSDLDLKVLPPTALEIEDLTVDSTIKLIREGVNYEVFITQRGRLIGEVSLSNLLYLSNWSPDLDVRVDKLSIKPLRSLDYNDPVVALPEQIGGDETPKPIGVSYENSLVGLIYIEDVFQAILSLLESRELSKISSLKLWTLAYPTYPSVYIDDSVSKSLRLLRNARDRRTLIVYNRNEEAVGLIDIKSVFRGVLEHIEKLLVTQKTY